MGRKAGGCHNQTSLSVVFKRDSTDNISAKCDAYTADISLKTNKQTKNKHSLLCSDRGVVVGNWDCYASRMGSIPAEGYTVFITSPLKGNDKPPSGILAFKNHTLPCRSKLMLNCGSHILNWIYARSPWLHTYREIVYFQLEYRIRRRGINIISFRSKANADTHTHAHIII